MPDFNHFLKVVLTYLKKISKLVTAIFIIAIFFIFSTLWYFSSDLPDYKILANYKPPVSSRVHSGEGQLIAEYALQSGCGFLSVGRLQIKSTMPCTMFR